MTRAGSPSGSALAGLRRRLITGLIVIAPVGVTAFVLWWIFQVLDGVLGQFFRPLLPVHIPGLGLLALFLLLLGTGWLAERAVGGRVIEWWESFFERFPLTRGVYGASSRIIRTVFEKERRPFREVVLFEYPSDGRWAVGFIAADAPPFARGVADEPSVTVFMPTTPNPTTGFLVIVPRRTVEPIPITIEEAFTFLFSAGTVAPEDERGEPRPFEGAALRGEGAEARPRGAGDAVGGGGRAGSAPRRTPEAEAFGREARRAAERAVRGEGKEEEDPGS